MCSPLLWPILCREAGRRPLCRAAEICSASGYSEGSSPGAERWSGSGIFAWRKWPDSRGENPLGEQVELRGKSIGSNGEGKEGPSVSVGADRLAGIRGGRGIRRQAGGSSSR